MLTERMASWALPQAKGTAAGPWGGGRGGVSAEHAAPAGSPPALAAAGSVEGSTRGLHEDGPNVLLVPGRALQVGHGVDLPGHGLSLWGVRGSDLCQRPQLPFPMLGAFAGSLRGWHLPAGKRWAPGVPPPASPAPPGPAAGLSCSPPAALAHPCRSDSPLGTTVGGGRVKCHTGVGDLGRAAVLAPCHPPQRLPHLR